MTSKHSRKTKENKEEFILDLAEKDLPEIKPKTTEKEEAEFIAKTIAQVKEPLKSDITEVKEPEPVETKVKHDSLVKHIDDVQHGIKKDIEIRKIIQNSHPRKDVRKTADLLGQGFHYVMDLEEKFTHDFLFGYLPRKIQKYIKLIIPITLLFVILSLPLNVEPDMKKGLALFVCISLLWALESISMIVTALSIPVLAIMLGLVKNNSAFSSFSNPIIYLLLSGLIIAQAFRKHELDKMIAVKVLALSKGELKRLLLFTMVITAMPGMWMSNTATIALLIPVILSISLEINHKTEKNYTTMLLLSAGFASSIGSLSTMIGSNPNAITSAFLTNLFPTFNFLDWSRIGFPVALILFTVTYLVMLKIFNVKNVRISITELKKEARRTKLDPFQRKILMIFFPTIFLWLFGGKFISFLNLPGDFYSLEVIGLSASILLFAFRVLEWDDVRRVPWEILLLVGGGLTLGQILIDTGAASLLASSLFSLFSLMPRFFIIWIMITITMLLSNFVNNSSAAIIMVPVILELSPLVNINPVLFSMSAALATGIAPLTPIAMPSFSLIYSTGKIKRADMIRTGLIVASISGPILAGLIYLVNIMFF